MADRITAVNVNKKGSYSMGNNYGRYLAAYEYRYGLIPMNAVDARTHAKRMADDTSDAEVSHFVRGFLDGYALEGR